MSILQKTFFCFFLLIASFSTIIGKEDHKAPENWEEETSFSENNFSAKETMGLDYEGDFSVVECEEVIKTAAKVDAIGQLKVKSNGYVYVDVSNQYVDEIWEMLPIQDDFKKLPTDGKKVGAHISVLYEDELIGDELWEPKEVGDWFAFEVKELRYICKKTMSGEKKRWILSVDAPELERLRVQYGFKPKLYGNLDFHITIGKEYTDFSVSTKILRENSESEQDKGAV